MAKVATRVAYGDALKELMVENKNVVVFDAGVQLRDLILESISETPVMESVLDGRIYEK